MIYKFWTSVFVILFFFLGSFVLAYEPDCIRTFTDLSGSFQTPNYPGPYPGYSHCYWTIQAPLGYKINLLVHDYDLYTISVYVYDGKNSSAQEIWSFQGFNNNSSHALTSSKNIMFIAFDSYNNDNCSTGFNISWESNTACGSEISGSSGVLQSPYFDQNYYIKDNCWWIIKASEGKQITLNVEEFELDSSWDSFSIRDGQYETSPLIGSFSGVDIPRILSSTGNYILINLTRSLSSPHKGFTFTWNNTECGGYFKTSTGGIISPNYPYPYPLYINCIWIIEPQRAFPIKLNVFDFELYNSYDCQDEYLEVRGGSYGSAPLIGRFCGNSILVDLLTSNSDAFYLHFVSSKTGYSGFNLTWSYL